MSEQFGIILDVLVVVLLVATIGYAAVLNARLKRLRTHPEDLQAAVRAFVEASVKAETGIRDLKRMADEASTSLAAQTERAQSLRDDFAFLVEASEVLAKRLEAGGRRGAPEERAEPEAKVAPLRGGRRPLTAERPGHQPDPDLVKLIESMR